MRIRWTKIMVLELKEMYYDTSSRELCKRFGVTMSSLRTKANKLGLKKKPKYRKWTSSEKEDLKKLYPDSDNSELVAYFKRPVFSIYNMACNLKIKKSEEYINKAKKIWTEHVKKVGHKYRFYKGQPSWNKGVKGYMGSNRTSFKKGNRPPNFVEIGTESLDRDGYTKVKIEHPNVWELKHRVIWKERFGEIPDKHAVIFLDGNKQNFDLFNLALVHRRDLLYFNRYGKYPPEIMEAQKLIIQLKNLIKNNGKEQD